MEQRRTPCGVFTSLYSGHLIEKALELYAEGRAPQEICDNLGIACSETIRRWAKEEGIARSRSEAQKLVPKNRGEGSNVWKGDKVGYQTQHRRAQRGVSNIENFWCIPCLLLNGIYKKAEVRARIDGTNLPYRIEYILPMCQSCNVKHGLHNGRWDSPRNGGFVILFEEVA